MSATGMNELKKLFLVVKQLQHELKHARNI